MYLHHLPQLMAQVGLDAEALGSQGYHIAASVVVRPCLLIRESCCNGCTCMCLHVVMSF